MANANASRFKMSQERLDEIKQELYYLATVREKEDSELIKEADKVFLCALRLLFVLGVVTTALFLLLMSETLILAAKALQGRLSRRWRGK